MYFEHSAQSISIWPLLFASVTPFIVHIFFAAEIYMNRQMQSELYYEEYDNVAIMFATITNYDIDTDATVDTERNILSILNRIICDFDEKLLSKRGPLKLEKIKVSGWTYMVACGLDPGRSDSSASLNNGLNSPNQRTSVLSNGRRSWNTLNLSQFFLNSSARFLLFFFVFCFVLLNYKKRKS